MNIDLAALAIPVEARIAVARFYTGMVETLMAEGVPEWIAREEARNMAIALMLYGLESGAEPPWEG